MSGSAELLDHSRTRPLRPEPHDRDVLMIGSEDDAECSPEVALDGAGYSKGEERVVLTLKRLDPDHFEVLGVLVEQLDNPERGTERPRSLESIVGGRRT